MFKPFVMQDRKRYKHNSKGSWREFIGKIKGLRCSKCGYDKCLSALDFHHVDPKTKSFGISQFIGMQAFNRVNKLRVFEELQKCIILCSNCHRELHHANKE